MDSPLLAQSASDSPGGSTHFARRGVEHQLFTANVSFISSCDSEGGRAAKMGH